MPSLLPHYPTEHLLLLQTEKFSSIASSTETSSPVPAVSTSPEQQAEAGHESMKSMLISSTETPARRSRASRGRGHAQPSAGIATGWGEGEQEPGAGLALAVPVLVHNPQLSPLGFQSVSKGSSHCLKIRPNRLCYE